MQEYNQKQEQENLLTIHCCKYEENIFPWRYVEFCTPSWRFYWNPVPGGYIRIAGEKEEVALTSEHFYILPGYLRFSTQAKTPFSQFYVHFSLNERLAHLDRMFQLPTDERSIDLIQRFIHRKDAQENRQLDWLTAASVVASALMNLPEEVLRLPPEHDPRIERVLAWIHRHLDGVYGNDLLAEKAMMSRNGFLRLFETEVGEPPQKYCRRKRIERACEMLLFSDLPLEEIATQTGFFDRYHFSRVFKSVMNFTPASFRRFFRS